MTDELRAKFEATFPHLDFSADSYGNYYSQRTLDHLYGYQAAQASRDAEVEALKRKAFALDALVAAGFVTAPKLLESLGIADSAMAKESGE